MRKEHKAALHRMFSYEFLGRYPSFERQAASRPYFNKSELVFRQASGESSFVVILSPHPSGHEAFTVELGWSRIAVVPQLSMRPSPGDPRDEQARERSEFVTRLGYIDEHVPEFWYIGGSPPPESPEEAMRRLLESTQPMTASQAEANLKSEVDAAIDATARIGIPYLESMGLVLQSPTD